MTVKKCLKFCAHLVFLIGGMVKLVHTFYPPVAHSHPGDKKVSLCGGLTSCIAYMCKCLFSLLSSKPNRTLSVETSFIFRMLLHLLILVISACFASKIPGNLVQVFFTWCFNQHQHCPLKIPGDRHPSKFRGVLQGPEHPHVPGCHGRPGDAQHQGGPQAC